MVDGLVLDEDAGFFAILGEGEDTVVGGDLVV